MKGDLLLIFYWPPKFHKKLRAGNRDLQRIEFSCLRGNLKTSRSVGPEPIVREVNPK